jgi:hypothetical protein
MYCPQCQSEYREGIVRCSDCDILLVPEYFGAEHQHAGNLIPLAEDTSPDLVAELIDRLEKARVPYVIEAGTALEMFANEDVVLNEPQPWEARVWIAESFHDRASQILSEVDQQFGRRRVALT